jgi:hypothetical protein
VALAMLALRPLTARVRQHGWRVVVDGVQLRAVLLEVVADLSQQHSHLQSGSILHQAASRLRITHNPGDEQALLTFFHDLFRTGYLSWGADLANPSPPFCHVTDLGRRALARHSRDPANPDGYLSHLNARASVGDVTTSYIAEALNTFNAACFKATAVMVGAAAESVVLEIRDVLVAKLQALGHALPRDLTDWRIKRVLVAIETLLETKKTTMPQPLFERFEANWPAFTHQIRTVRNDAGHPLSVDPVTADEVHASLLIFPELAALASELRTWIEDRYS